jgi:hypothetical protein
MFKPSRRATFASLGLSSLVLLGAGYAAKAHTALPSNFRPAPAATTIVGTAAGPLFYVQNNGTTAYDTYGVLGVAGVGPLSIGVLGYGANSGTANLALTGYDIGPGSVATVGYAAYPEPSGGPGSTQTTGVLGIAPDGDGVEGQTSVVNSYTSGGASAYAGVVGVDNASNGGYNSGVVGKTTNGAYGVQGISSTGAYGGVAGIGTDGDGVDGNSTSGKGVYGSSSTDVGVFGYSTSGDGVYAESTTSYGLYASSASAPAIYAESTYIAMQAKADINGGKGAYLETVGPNGSGSYAENLATTGNGVGSFGEGFAGVDGQARDASSYALIGANSSGSTVFSVDNSGNVAMVGTTGELVKTQQGAVGRMFVSKSTMQTMEDFGSGELVNGAGVVHLDPSFAQMIDGGGYQVFLTPDGDNRGLFVAAKSASSFVVRESQGGHSTLAFDYRILARQYGHAADRASIATSTVAFGMPQVNPGSPPIAGPQGAAAGHSVASKHKRAASSATRSSINTYAIPRAVDGLAHSLSH